MKRKVYTVMESPSNIAIVDFLDGPCSVRLTLHDDNTLDIEVRGGDYGEVIHEGTVDVPSPDVDDGGAA